MNSVFNFFKKLSSYDHRQAQRRQMPMLVAYYWDGDAPMAHEVRDISATGFYITTKERWHLGTIITMTLQRTDSVVGDSGTQLHISVLSKVIRLDENGVGFAFIPIDTQGDNHSGGGRLATRPVGKKTLHKFLEQIKSEGGHPVIGYIKATLKKSVLSIQTRRSPEGAS